MNENPQSPDQQQYQPGQAYQPGQTAVPAPQLPPMPPVQQPVMPPPQYQAPVAAPQPIYTPPQPPIAPTQPLAPSLQQEYGQIFEQPSYARGGMSGFKGLSTKMLIGVAGLVASLFIIFIVISAVLNRGTDAKLTTFDESKISFVVDVPEGWNVLGNNYSGADVLVAKPPELAETDSRTILNVTRNTNAKPGSVEDFRKKTQETIQLLNNSEYQSSQNIRVSDVSTATFGTDAAPGYKASFTLRDISSGETYKSFAYFIYESKDTATNITLVLDSTNEKYAEVADTIVSSYRKR